MTDVLTLLGGLLLISGVVLLSVPLGLIVAGLLLIVLSWRLS